MLTLVNAQSNDSIVRTSEGCAWSVDWRLDPLADVSVNLIALAQSCVQ